MNLLFDARCLAQPRTGIQVVAENSLISLHEWLPHGALTIIAGAQVREQFAHLGRPMLSCDVAPYDFFRQGEVARLINAQPDGLFVCPTYFVPFGVRKRFVVNVYDLIPRTVWLGLPTLYFRLVLGHTLRRARTILTCSEYSRDRIVEAYPGVANRVRAVSPGFTSASPTSETRAPRELLLFLSRFRHKNCGFALDAFQELQRLSDSRWHLHLVGNPSERDEQKILGMSGVTRHARIDDEALHALYGRAWGLLLPSLEEGFSLPLLEGMSHGCLVFYHRPTAMRETAGDGAIGLDLGSPRAWAEAILDLAQDPQRCAELQRKAVARASSFTRERFDSELRAALEEAYAEP
jgi:glycosyltransferase involved in cell wall biosynthesis